MTIMRGGMSDSGHLLPVHAIVLLKPVGRSFATTGAGAVHGRVVFLVMRSHVALMTTHNKLTLIRLNKAEGEKLTSHPPHSPDCQPRGSSALSFPFTLSPPASPTCGVNPSTTSSRASFSSLVASVYPRPGQNLRASTAWRMGIKRETTTSHARKAGEANSSSWNARKMRPGVCATRPAGAPEGTLSSRGSSTQYRHL